ncbi:MAG: DUF47 family protein [Coriobacteriales bacterium]|jgi:uncharacterized protein Yka (UPF0111/DUF47 family)|nr:DUF47 family protein [Coriobacteriales bacterium]
MPQKHKFNYFDAFERQIAYACKEADFLHRIFREFKIEDVPENQVAMHEIENAADGENHEIFQHLALEFVTPIDREDIIELANHLDDIIDYIEDVMQRLYMFNITYIPREAVEMAVLIEKSVSALQAALKDFRNFKKSKTLDQLLINVNDYEEEADRLYLDAIRGLYTDHTDDPIYVLGWNNIFSHMEKCCDACENTATAMGTIIMKNS